MKMLIVLHYYYIPEIKCIWKVYQGHSMPWKTGRVGEGGGGVGGHKIISQHVITKTYLM